MRSAPERILVRAPNWVGDVVMATPALRALRIRFPGSRIAVLAKRNGLTLLDGLGSFDEGLEQQKGLWDNVRRIRAFRPDLAVLFPNSHSSALAAFLALVPHRLGYDLNARGLMLTMSLRPRMDRHRRVPMPMTAYYLDLVGRLDAGTDDDRVELAATDDGRERAEAWLAERGVSPDERFVGVAPGASFGPSKLWLPDRFGVAAGALAERHGRRVLLLGGPGEESLGQDVAAAAGASVVNPDGAWTDFTVLKALIERCDLALTTDSGIRHVATAIGVATVVLMGPTDPRYSASNLSRTSVLREEVDCGPCHLKVCPTDHRCMERIPADRAIEAGERLLTEGGAS